MPGIDCFNTSHSTSPYNSPFTWVLAIKMVTQRPEGRLLPRCCIFFPTQNGSTPPSTEPVRCLSIFQPDLQILAPLSVHSIRRALQHYLHSPPHKNQTLHERKRKRAHFKASGRPPLAAGQASAEPSCLSSMLTSHQHHVTMATP